MPPEDFHRLEMLIMNNADEKTEDIGELTHEIAENLRQALLNITNGEASLPVPPPNYNYIFVNALRTDHPLDATSISTLFDNAPPEFAEAAAQAAQILAQLPAEAQANADIVINRLTNRYRSDMQHHQQTFPEAPHPGVPLTIILSTINPVLQHLETAEMQKVFHQQATVTHDNRVEVFNQALKPGQTVDVVLYSLPTPSTDSLHQPPLGRNPPQHGPIWPQSTLPNIATTTRPLNCNASSKLASYNDYTSTRTVTRGKPVPARPLC